MTAARYDGPCGMCSDPINVGDDIAHEDGIVHAEHVAPITSPRRVVICDDCRMVRPCECDGGLR